MTHDFLPTDFDPHRLISVYRASRRLGIAPRHLMEAIQRDQLTAFRPGKRTWYLRWPDVLRWLERESRRRNACGGQPA